MLIILFCGGCMRIFELFFILLTSITIVLFQFKQLRSKAAIHALSILSFIILVLHTIIEGMRWQLVPLYGACFALLVIAFLYLLNVYHGKAQEGRLLRYTLVITSTFLLLVTVLLLYALPITKMPAPSGSYHVGTQSFTLIDETRPAIYSSDLNDHRKINYQMWYPSDDVDGYEQAPWLYDGKPIAKGVAKMMGLPAFSLNHTTLIESHSYIDAPLSNKQDQYPVVIISHGWTGFLNLHTDIAELLASHGYIVISIDHTYGSAATVFEDDVAYLNRDALPNRDKTPNFLDYGNTLINTYAGDITALINQMETFNNGDTQFTDKLDLDQIGLIGHSTGAGAAVTTAIQDERVKLVLGMDAWVEPIKEEVTSQGLDIPSLFLRSEEWEDKDNNINLYQLIKSSTKTPELYQIDGTKHLDFTMVYMYSPISSNIGITGPLDGFKSAKIQQDIILNFFNTHVKHDSDEMDQLLEQYSNINQVTVE